MGPGTVVAGRYVIQALAGSGGMASVYKAHDQQHGRVVAIKVLKSDAMHMDERFAREARMLHDLYHPAIVRYLDSGVTRANWRYLVMEWLDGESLLARLGRQPLSFIESLALISRIASALAFIHGRGLIHRDIKPGNIFLPGGCIHATKLLDFGIARNAGASSTLTASGAHFGTPAYMSPEQVRSADHLSSPTDIFSLGCVLYECVTGTPAYAAGNPLAVFYQILMEQPPRLREVLPTVPEPIDALLERMLAKDPAERPQSAEIIIEIQYLIKSLSEEMLHQEPHRIAAREALTESEQRIVHVVVAASAALFRLNSAPTLGLQALDGSGPVPKEEAEAPLPPGLAEENPLSPVQLQRIAQSIEPIGARMSQLRDGSVIAVLENRLGSGSAPGTAAVDQAASAARCALRLKQELAGNQIVVAGGKAVIDNRRLLGQAMERAFELLSTSRSSDAPAGPLKAEIRIDTLTARLLGPGFQVAGDEEHGYSLLGEHARVSRATAKTPFVGRKQELARLMGLLDASIEQKTINVAIVTGHLGYGKSRLCRELLACAEQREEMEIWFARADTMRAGSPLAVMADAIRAMAGIVDSQPMEQRRYTLDERIARYLSCEQARPVAAFLGELLGLPPGQSRDDVQLAAARRNPKLMGDRLRRACIDLIDAVTGRHPLLIVIEDFQWADRATVEVLDLALRNLAERPLSILAFARPEYRQTFPELWSEHSATEIRLGRLPNRDAECLVRSILGPYAPGEQVAALVAQADGHPFFLEELARHAATGKWDDLPETILAMVEARLSTLDPHARYVLRAASVFGETFWHGGVQALIGDRIAAHDWLASLAAHDWIRATPGGRFAVEEEYVFRHSLVRDVAYAMLTEEDHLLGHRLAASWLAEIGEPHAGVIADHFARGDSPGRAIPYYVQAAEDALARNDLDAAVTWGERGIQCGAHGAMLGRIRCIQVEERIWRGSQSEVAALGSEAMERLPQGSQRWYRIAAETGIAWVKLGKLDKAEQIAAELGAAGKIIGERTDWLIATAKLSQQLIVSDRRDLGLALLAAAECAVGNLEAADPSVAADIHCARALRADALLGDPGAVLEELTRCAACFQEIGDLRQSCLHRSNVGYAKIELGLYREAEADLRAALAMAEHERLDAAANAAKQQLVVLLARLGLCDEAERFARQACAWYSRHRDDRMMCMSRLYLATVLVLTDKLDDAEHECITVLALLPQTALLRPWALSVMARIHLLRHASKEALTVATEALALFKSLGSLEGDEATVRLAYAEALAANGKREEARSAIAQARERLLYQASRISQPDWRRSFLEEIPDHARTLKLAAQWEEEAK